MSIKTEHDSVWEVATGHEIAEAELCRALNIPPLLARVLVNRQIDTPEAAYHFLNPKLDDLHDPATLPDFEVAKDAILGAIERREKIFVHGDYDVDGVSSAALFTRFLQKIGADVVTHVPHRIKEGYGIHGSAVSDAAQEGAKLFLTCDCGITAHEAVEAARSEGMTVVVTDHHTVGHDMPNAHAVVNPHRSDSAYPFQNLSGSGVVFKLCAGLTKELGHSVEAYYRAYLDLAVLGTVADVMPLVDENRIITKFGLERLKETKKPGLRALMKEARINVATNEGLRTFHIGYQLGPRLNAAGRIDDADIALKLLLSTDEGESNELAARLEALNDQRRLDQQSIVEEAIEMVYTVGQAESPVIVVGSADWHPGIIGIAAGKLVEHFRRPVFVVSIDTDKGIGKGSGRSIPGFDLAKAIRAHPELLSGGGHAMAAGFGVDADRLQEAATALAQYGANAMEDVEYTHIYRADAEVFGSDMNLETVQSLSLLEPFGDSNPEPQFVIRNVAIEQLRPSKKPEHMLVTVKTEDGVSVRFTAFNAAEKMSGHGKGVKADMLITPYVDTYYGTPEVKWKLRDYRLAH